MWFSSKESGAGGLPLVLGLAGASLVVVSLVQDKITSFMSELSISRQNESLDYFLESSLSISDALVQEPASALPAIFPDPYRGGSPRMRQFISTSGRLWSFSAGDQTLKIHSPLVDTMDPSQLSSFLGGSKDPAQLKPNQTTKVSFKKLMKDDPAFPEYISSALVELEQKSEGRTRKFSALLPLPPPSASVRLVGDLQGYTSYRSDVFVDGVAVSGEIRLYSNNRLLEKLALNGNFSAANSISARNVRVGSHLFSDLMPAERYSVEASVVGVDGSTFSDSRDFTTPDYDRGLKDIFNYGKPDVFDFLFIIDQSISMAKVVERLDKAFKDLVSGSSPFPAGSKIAVMNTMVATSPGSSKPHPDLRGHKAWEIEPGFQHLINRSRIINFRNQTSSEYKGQWALSGCSQSWFDPQQRAAEGHFCMEAATQISLARVGKEPGMEAYAQFMRSPGGRGVFRNSSIVNVIFVSDTHDPGGRSDDLKAKAESKSYAGLRDLTLSSNPSISGVKFHGIVPSVKCTDEDLHSKSYHRIIDQSEGVKKNVCKVSSFKSFIRKMISKSDEPKDVTFALSRPEYFVKWVSVNGKRYSNYQVSSDFRYLLMRGLDSDSRSKIVVKYGALRPVPEEYRYRR